MKFHKLDYLYLLSLAALIGMYFFAPVFTVDSSRVALIGDELALSFDSNFNWTYYSFIKLFGEQQFNLAGILNVSIDNNIFVTAFTYLSWGVPAVLGAAIFLMLLGARFLSKFLAFLGFIVIAMLLAATRILETNLREALSLTQELFSFHLAFFVYLGVLFILIISWRWGKKPKKGNN